MSTIEVVKDYRLIDGTPCTLERLCREEPEWAANRIRLYESDSGIAALLRVRVVKFSELKRLAVLGAVKRNSGNLSKAARDLGLGRTTLYRLAQKWGNENLRGRK